MFRSPQSILNDIEVQIQSLIGTHVYYRKDAPEIDEVLASIAKLDSQYQVAADRVRALAFAITGQTDQAISVIESSKAISSLAPQYVGILTNAGRNLKAQECYAKYLSPISGLFTEHVSLGFASGAFHLVAEFARAADKQMDLTNLEGVPMELIREADEMLAEFGIDDKTIGSLFDEAGIVFEENKIFYVGTQPDVEVIDLPGVMRNLLVTFRLPVSSEKTSNMYLQFIDRLIDNSISVPAGLQINFASAPVL